MNLSKIVPSEGVTGNFLLGQTISQVLSRLQSQPKSFGRISIIQAPLTILADSGFKFLFDQNFQRLMQIEIFISLEQKEFRPPDMLIGGFSI